MDWDIISYNNYYQDILNIICISPIKLNDNYIDNIDNIHYINHKKKSDPHNFRPGT